MLLCLKDFEGVIRCLDTAKLWTVVDKVVSAEVHRIVIVDSEDRLVGIVTMSNIIRYLVLRPSQITPSINISTIKEGQGYLKWTFTLSWR